MKSYLKKSILFASLSILGFSSLSSEAAVCKDDPRMYTIKTVIDQIGAGEDVQPLKLTPQTFLELTPNVRNALADNIRVYDEGCVPVQVFNGELAKPIRVEYSLLEDAILRASIRGDKKTMKAIFQQFRAAEKEPLDIINMAKPAMLPSNVREFIYESTPIKKLPLEPEHEKRLAFCQRIESPITFVDLYSALGGKSTKNETIIRYSTTLTYNELGFQNIDGFGASTYYLKYIVGNDDHYCSEYNMERAHSSILRTGLNIEYINNNKKRSLSLYKEKMANAKAAL